MNMYELLVLAVGLSMDAFAVAICKGLAIRTVSLKHAAWVGLWFGGFQMLMPLLGSVCRAGRGPRRFVRPRHAPVGHCHQH